MEILVGIDGTDHGLAAARWAADEARTLSVPLTLLHVYSVPAVPSVAGPLRTPEQRKTAKAHADAAMRQAQQVVREQLQGSSVSLSTEVLEGPTIGTLLDMSANARLLVLGSHSGLLFEHRLGSVAGACLHKAHCPVVVVPVEVVASATGTASRDTEDSSA